MAVSLQPLQSSFTASGMTREFAFAFRILDALDLQVTVDGRQAALAQIVGVGSPSGGAVQLMTMPAAGAQVVVRRVTRLLRWADYQPLTALRAEALNADFDRLWLALQEQGAQIGGLTDALGTAAIAQVVSARDTVLTAMANANALAAQLGTALTGLQQANRIVVQSFGIAPDGATDWEGQNPGGRWTEMLDAARAGNVIVFPPGYYATGLNLDATFSGCAFHFEPGAILGGVFHLISSASPTATPIASISRSSNVVLVTTSAAHGFANGQSVQVQNVVSSGSGSVSFNGDAFVATVISATTFTYPQNGPDAVGQVGAGALVAETPIKNVRVTGLLTTTDRLGSINAKNCTIQAARILNDPNRHSAYPGQPPRGVHIYAGTDGLVIGDLVIDTASGANTDAALALDGNAWNPRNCTFGRVWVKDSDYHGVYLTGGGHTFGELRIDGFAAATYGGTLQDSNGAAQSQQLKGLWINRCWDTHISVLRTSQHLAGSRGSEIYQVLVDETGSEYFGAASRKVTIGQWFARNVRRNGIALGDLAAYDSVRCNLEVGSLNLQLATTEGVVGGLFALACNGASGGSNLTLGPVTLDGLGSSNGLYCETSADLAVSSLTATNHTGRVAQIRGRARIGAITGTNAGTGNPDPVLHLTNPACAGTSLGTIRLTAPSGATQPALVVDNGASAWDTGDLSIVGYTGAAMTLKDTVGWAIKSIRLKGSGSSGTGMTLSGNVTDGYCGAGRIEGYAKGLDATGATLTRLTAVGLNANGNTTPTNLAAGSVQMLGCNGVTL